MKRHSVCFSSLFFSFLSFSMIYVSSYMSDFIKWHCRKSLGGFFPSISSYNGLTLTITLNGTGTEDELLESVQRRGFKIITGGIVRTPTIHLYNEVGLETLKARRDRNVLLFFFKIINNMVPDYLRDLKPEKSTPGRYMFRNKDEFVPPEWRLRTYQKSFLPFAVSLWNSLEEDTRTISNYELFKETLMGNVKDNPLFHLGTRQEQIIMARLRMRSSDLKGHLHSMKIVESSACSCGFKNEDETHFFLACPLYYRPRVTLLNALAHIAPLTVRTLLYGNDTYEIEENKIIITETLRFIKESKRFDWWYIYINY